MGPLVAAVQRQSYPIDMNDSNNVVIVIKVGSLFYDAFSVTRLYSVDDRMISE